MISEAEFYTKLATGDERLREIFARFEIAKERLTAKLVSYVGDQISSRVNQRIQMKPEITLALGREKIAELKKAIIDLKDNECATFGSALKGENFWPTLESIRSETRLDYGYFSYRGAGYQKIESRVAQCLHSIGSFLHKWNYSSRDEYYKDFGGIPAKESNQWAVACKQELELIQQATQELAQQQTSMGGLKKALNELQARTLWESV